MIDKVAAIVARHPAARMRIVSRQEPAWSDPDHPMVRIIQHNAAEVASHNVFPIPSLAGTDARLWRQRGIAGLHLRHAATNVAMPDEIPTSRSGWVW